MLTSDQLLEMLQDPSKIGDQNEAELKQAAEKYPYCQALQFLWAQYFRRHNEHLFQRQLGKTALLTNDRSVLFEFFEEGAEVQAQASNASESRDRDEIRPGEWSATIEQQQGEASTSDQGTDSANSSTELSAKEAQPEPSPQLPKEEKPSSEPKEEGLRTTLDEDSPAPNAPEEKEPEASSPEQEITPEEAPPRDDPSSDQGAPSSTPSVPGSIQRERTARESAQELERNPVNDRIQKILERNRQLRNQFKSSTDAAQRTSSSSSGPTSSEGSGENSARPASSTDPAEKTASEDYSTPGESMETTAPPAPGTPEKEQSPESEDAEQVSRPEATHSQPGSQHSAPRESSAGNPTPGRPDSEEQTDSGAPPAASDQSGLEIHSLEEEAQIAQQGVDPQEETSLTTNELEEIPEERAYSELKPGGQKESGPGNTDLSSDELEAEQDSAKSSSGEPRDDDIERRIETIRSQLAQLQEEAPQNPIHPEESLPLEGQIQEEEYSQDSPAFTTNELDLNAETEDQPPKETSLPPEDAPSPQKSEVSGPEPESEPLRENPSDSLDEEFLEIEALVAQQRAESTPILVDEILPEQEKHSEEESDQANPATSPENDDEVSSPNRSTELETEAKRLSSEDSAPAEEPRSQEEESMEAEEAEPHSFSYWLKKLSQKEDQAPDSLAGETTAPEEAREPEQASKPKASDEGSPAPEYPPSPPEEQPEPKKDPEGKPAPENASSAKRSQEGLPVEDKIQLLDSFVEKLPELKKKRPEEKPNPTPEPKAQSSPESPEEPAQISLVTETLAQVYIKQKHYKKAIQAYEILKLKYPEKSSSFARQIEEIKNLNNSK